MQTKFAALVVVALALAACHPAAGPLPAALASAVDASAALYPRVAEEASDGYVFEYH